MRASARFRVGASCPDLLQAFAVAGNVARSAAMPARPVPLPPTPDRDAPRYAQVAADLRAAIRRGDYGADRQLPTETALCATYGVSRFTVREALRQLQTEKLISRRRGSGTVVEAAGADGGSLRQPMGELADLLQYAAGSTFIFRACGLTTLSAARARVLRVAAGERWHMFEGARTMAGHARPIALTQAYVHRDLAAAAAKLRSGHETIFSQLERHAGIHVARVTQDIQAVGAGAREAAALGIARRAPCLRILRCYIEADGRVAEMSVSLHPGELFTYSMRMDAAH